MYPVSSDLNIYLRKNIYLLQILELPHEIINISYTHFRIYHLKESTGFISGINSVFMCCIPGGGLDIERGFIFQREMLCGRSSDVPETKEGILGMLVVLCHYLRLT